MANYLSKFINNIFYSDNEFRFYGDGMGDYEEISNHIKDPKVLENYILECREQIALAKQYLTEYHYSRD